MSRISSSKKKDIGSCVKAVYISLGRYLSFLIFTDPDWKSQSAETFEKFDKQTIDELVTKMFPAVISNIRAATKIMPATAVFKE